MLGNLLELESVLKFEFVIFYCMIPYKSKGCRCVPISGIWHCCDVRAVPYARYLGYGTTVYYAI